MLAGFGRNPTLASGRCGVGRRAPRGPKPWTALRACGIERCVFPFHLAIPVRDLESSRAFYGALLGCREGRSSETWIDFDLFGHQLTVHVQDRSQETVLAEGSVDDVRVPIPHFGVVLGAEAWDALADRLERHDVSFVIEPVTRFAGASGEQSTLFLQDPSGNALEFKSMANSDNLFEA